jgi:hypothetical protein
MKRLSRPGSLPAAEFDEATAKLHERDAGNDGRLTPQLAESLGARKVKIA